MSTYRVDDGDSNEITVGLNEYNAYTVAQSIANRLGRTVYLSEDAEDSEPIEVRPQPASAKGEQ